MPIKRSIVPDNVSYYEPVNIYDSQIGEHTKIAAFVEIGGSTIGRFCKIEAFAFIPPGVEIRDYVFIGPHVCFTNDSYPKAATEQFTPAVRTIVGSNASIGANSTILPGLKIGGYSVIAAGSVVTHDVPEGQMWLRGEVVRTR